MHEAGLLKDLIYKITEIAKKEEAEHVTDVSVWLGALSHMSADHFRDHYEIAARGSPGEGANLDIELSTDETHPDAQSILLKSVGVTTLR